MCFFTVSIAFTISSCLYVGAYIYIFFLIVVTTTLTKLHIHLLTLTVTYLQLCTLFTGFFFLLKTKKNSWAITVFFLLVIQVIHISIVKLLFYN